MTQLKKIKKLVAKHYSEETAYLLSIPMQLQINRLHQLRLELKGKRPRRTKLSIIEKRQKVNRNE